VEEYQAAAKLDPTFDAPRAGIALATVSAIDYAAPAPLVADEARDRVIALADSVIQRNPSIAMAWIARGVALGGRTKSRFGIARENLERAVALEPSSAEAHFRLGQVFFRLGDYATARVSLLRSLALDPARPVTYELLGVVEYFERRPPDALRMLDSALSLDPQYALAMSWKVVVLYSTGDTANARAVAWVRAPLVGGSTNETQKAAIAAAKSLRDTVASITMTYHLAPQALAVAGRLEEALAALGTAMFPVCRHAINDPAFDSVRRDSRFRDYEAACLALKESNGGP
jgi:tetratricopeptide (TPR) repeat protein